MERFDVAVVGAGMAGLWCARELARRGASVLLVDARRSVDERVSTTGIFVRRTLADFDLPPACFGPPVRTVVLHPPRGGALELTCSRDEFRIAAMRPLLRTLLEQCTRFGVTYRPSTWYERAEPDGTALLLHLYGRHRAEAQRPSCRFLVGADGGRSRVAKDLGLSRNREFIVGIEQVYDNAESPLHGALHCFLDPVLAPGYIAWIACDGMQTHVGTGGYASRFAPHAALERFAAKHAALAALGDAAIVERRAGEIPVNGVLARIGGERGLLVGDAAGAVSPLTAGGLDGCVRLSQFAAETLIAALRRKDARAAMAAYDGRSFAPRLVARRWMRAALRYAPAFALEIACAAMRSTALRAVAENVFFGDGSFPSLAAAHPATLAHRPIG